MVGPENVDGLLVMAGAIANLCGRGGLASFCARFADMPMVTLSGEIPGAPNVLADNRTGIREAVTHLAEAHRRRRIAFIQGPPENQDAQERYEGYVAALAEHGLPFELTRVFKGNFSFASGEAAVAEASRGPGPLDERIDAVVAADDTTALGALRELGRRQILVPQKVSVVGFDDVAEAHISTPPLTTIKQPFAELGAEALRVLCQLLDGGRPPSSVRLPTKVVLRRSCGCVGAEARTSTRPSRRRSFEAELLARRDVVRAELQRATRGAFGAVPGWDERLVMTFAEQIRSGSDAFLRALRAMLDSLSEAGIPTAPVTSMVAVLGEQMIGCLGQDTELAGRVDDLIREAKAAASAYTPGTRRVKAR